jgi:tRNA (cmo5U34)-methyltransferase
VLAGNYRAYASQPLLMSAWAARWRMHGAAAEEMRAKLDRILHGAEPPASEEAVFALLAEAGFEQPLRFFASLFWGAWAAVRGQDSEVRVQKAEEGV